MLIADRYRLDAAIGRGGMGEVWRASDEVLGRPVAVKMMLNSESDEQATARFRLEAQTAARLNHPHVVTVFDFGSWNDHFYLVMELVEGISLAQALTSGGTFSPRRVADVAAHAAAGLAAAHRQGVVHRDIKPGNLMQDVHGTVKIADFGIARFVDDPSAALTSAGQIVGSSLYLAPERALGRPAGPGSDVYALGCVLYQLLVGEPPFQADTATVVLHMHVTAPPSPPSFRCSELPGAFETYLLRMLAKNPEERPSAQEVTDWFSGPLWHGSAQQLPTPEAPVVPATYALPQTTFQTGGGGGRRRAPQTQQRAARLPQTQQHAARAPQTRQRSIHAPQTPQRGAADVLSEMHIRIRAHMRRHKILTGVVVGAVTFAIAALLGMAMFSPDAGGSQQPGANPSQSANTTPATSASPTASPVGLPTAAPTVLLQTNPVEPKNADG